MTNKKDIYGCIYNFDIFIDQCAQCAANYTFKDQNDDLPFIKRKINCLPNLNHPHS